MSQLESNGIASHRLLGESPRFIRVLSLLERVAPLDMPIVIQGETGTGKELAARELHRLSRRQSKPFLAVNCGAIPDSLVESELFGHVQGAFTDAKKNQPGLIALANGGSLFLDEVDALSRKAQATLLRFLQSHEYRPVGSARLEYADVRVIAATNACLNSSALECEHGFRSDLWYRLNVVPVVLPPLRERGLDIDALAYYFLNRYAENYGEPKKNLDADALRWLREYSWPGNVRELQNLMHRTLVLIESRQVGAADLARLVRNEQIPSKLAIACPPLSQDMVSFRDAKHEVIRDFERRYLRKLMLRSRGNVTLAAELAGKERRALGKLLKKYGIDRNEYVA